MSIRPYEAVRGALEAAKELRAQPFPHAHYPLQIILTFEKSAFVEIEHCIDPIVSRIALPPPKDRDTYYRAVFYIVSP